MKTKHLLSVLLIFFAAGIISSCKKDKEETPAQCDITVANLAGDYKLTAATATSAGIEVSVLHSLYDDCELDDIYTLKTNMDAVQTDAGVECFPDNNGTSTWSLSGTTITIDAETGTITKFNCSTVEISNDLGSTTYKVTYTRQ